jgi:rare lipoprotein A
MVLLAVSACSVVGYPAGAPSSSPQPEDREAVVSGGAGADAREPTAGERAASAGPELPRTSGLREGASDEDLEAIPDARPVQEEKSRYGNRPEYEVFGVTYRVLESSVGYEEEGLASWYGEEFQGRPTSSREPYDMYLMTAAHRSLPLPTYVEVTNLENGRIAVVRVNDRGPFHPDRIIDLSYVAARKLGYVGAGTARVRVRALEPAAR